MHRRPTGAVGTLPQASLLPLLNRKRSSLVSSTSSPHTPTKGNSPLPFFATNTNRNSASSWNSSNYDVDDIEWEWKQDQIKLLTRVSRVPSNGVFVTPLGALNYFKILNYLNIYHRPWTLSPSTCSPLSTALSLPPTS